MACTPTRCNNCKRKIKACEKTRAKDGKSVCKYCESSYNNKK